MQSSQFLPGLLLRRSSLTDFKSYGWNSVDLLFETRSEALTEYTKLKTVLSENGIDVSEPDMFKRRFAEN